MFWKLRNAGLKLSAKKYSLGFYEISYLGHVITRNCMKADPAKVQCVKNFRPPSTPKELL